MAKGDKSSKSKPAAKGKPNVLFIMGDDIGWFNVSAYNMGIMGYRTPNIDRIAKEGALFTDWYGQQSCTAGRAAFTSGLPTDDPMCRASHLPSARCERVQMNFMRVNSGCLQCSWDHSPVRMPYGGSPLSSTL